MKEPNVFERVRRKPGHAAPSVHKATNEALLAMMRLPFLGIAGGAMAFDSVLRFAIRRTARKICRERQKRIQAAKEAFVERLVGIYAAPEFDKPAYEAALAEFDAARQDDEREWTNGRAEVSHRRAKALRESAWKAWTEEVVGELQQLVGFRTTLSDFKTPVLEILGKSLTAMSSTLDDRRAVRNAPYRELKRRGLLPDAPGESGKRRKGAPIKRLCQWSVQPPPGAEALLEGWKATRGHGKVAEKIRLGSMLLDAEAHVDSSLVRDANGEIVGRREGLKGWLKENCPGLLPHYAALMKFRRLAAAFREEHGVGDPVPAAALTDERNYPQFTAAFREKLRGLRKSAKALLAREFAKTETSFMRELVDRRERRKEREADIRRAKAEAWRRVFLERSAPGATAGA